MIIVKTRVLKEHLLLYGDKLTVGKFSTALCNNDLYPVLNLDDQLFMQNLEARYDLRLGYLCGFNAWQCWGTYCAN